LKYFFGVILILFALIVISGTFLPVLREEINYDLGRYGDANDTKDIKPIDTDFGILIPKIGANAHVIKNVDPFNSKEYQAALTRGVAHAKGTSLPGQPGNVFFFSHSSSDFLNASRYNSIFYLLTKLEMGDKIKIFYEGQEYTYQVTTKKIVNSDAISHLSSPEKGESLTLMTCWPPGTALKRLIVQATRR
jgi:sortase A